METEEQLKNIIKTSKQESLSLQEKAVIKSQILHFMQKNPVQPVYHWRFWQGLTLHYVSFAVMMFLVTGGGIAFAAQNTLPGDWLYPVKTEVTEKVLAWTLFSEQAKVQYDIDLTKLRLQETETIAYQNKLDDKKSAQVKALLDEHINNINSRVLGLSGPDKAKISIEINSQLEASLKAHANSIDALAVKTESHSESVIHGILSDVKSKTDVVKKIREQDESVLLLNLPVQASLDAENKLAEAQVKIREATLLAEQKKNDINDMIYRKVQADTALASQYIVDGKKALELKNDAQAFIFFQNALRQAQETNIYISNESRLKIINIIK